MKGIKLTLLYPPSANRHWRHAVVGKGKFRRAVTYLSEEAKAYKAEVARRCEGLMREPMTGAVKLTLDIYRPRKSGDLSNRIKVCEDALNGIAFLDDKQVFRSWRTDTTTRATAESRSRLRRSKRPAACPPEQGGAR